MLFEELVSWDTIVNYNNYFRLECHNWILNQQQQLGGFDANGQPRYVEVDESYFFYQKYHKGRRRSKHHARIAGGVLHFLELG